jgi:flagellar protein FlbT
MGLKLTLKPHEKCIIGGAAIQNGNKTASLFIANQTTVLRERHIMTEEMADTYAKQIYFVVQLIYLDGGIDKSKPNHDIFFSIVKKFMASCPSTEALDFIGEIGTLILECHDYQALMICQKLVDLEDQLIKRPMATAGV